MSNQDLSQLDDVLAMLTGEAPVTPSPTAATSSSVNAPINRSATTPSTATTTARSREEETQRQPRPTIAALDAFMSNLTSAFDSLEVGGKSSAGDELSNTIFNINSVVQKEREQSLLKLVNLSVDGTFLAVVVVVVVILPSTSL
eukprot:TRINITY_DN4492_c0_g1_i2.p1 TRINITY_DN4492_c0_g1~~TRINITY_DN4492_c0_g1_i2.p1  ORF type:complete len:162 (-),score=52.02 TRINITY_DN4492_c0_g1_i2:10-441(-)